ncbi:FeoC-like transcriptional regulator [Gudongella sp. DL1XJH-153]|uniref:FeoC-like transcriptional regulator n=1 Tax=Gudongella sp. DL1XJH-153 TaxID=3409804 RepID=UPI003BB4C0BC
MLKEVLKEIKDAKVYSKQQISKNLGVSENVLEDMIRTLVRMGYLDEDLGSPTCETKCSGCSVSSCNTIPLKMLSLTKKGEDKINS